LSSKFSDWRDVAKKVSMSEKAGRTMPFMKETACVHVEEREMLAWIQAYPLISPEDNDFIEFLEKVVKPVLMKVGRARWYRDTITDLGFALASRKKKDDSEDTGKILDVEVEE